MARRIYKFTDKKHTRQGMVSVATGVVSMFLLVITLTMAYRSSGNGSAWMGLWGALGLLSTVLGILLAVKGFQEEDVYYLFSQIGVVLNGLFFILWVLIFILGM